MVDNSPQNRNSFDAENQENNNEKFFIIVFLLLIIICSFVCFFTIKNVKNSNLIKKIKNDDFYNVYTLKSINNLLAANLFKIQNNEICIVASDNICFFDSNKYHLTCEKTKIHIPQQMSYKVSGIEIKNNLYLLICGNLYKVNYKTKNIAQIFLNHKFTTNSKLFQINTSDLLVIDSDAIYIYNTENNSLIKTNKSLKHKREDFNAINISPNQILVLGGFIPTLLSHQYDSNKIYYENQIYKIEKKNKKGDITIKKNGSLVTLVNPKNTYEIFEVSNNNKINQYIGNIDLDSNFVRLQSLPSGNVFVLGSSVSKIFDIKTKTLKKIRENSFNVNCKNCVPIKLNNGNALFICENKNSKNNIPHEKIIIKYDENQNKFEILTKQICFFSYFYRFIQGIQLSDNNILIIDLLPTIITMEKKQNKERF